MTRSASVDTPRLVFALSEFVLTTVARERQLRATRHTLSATLSRSLPSAAFSGTAYMIFTSERALPAQVHDGIRYIHIQSCPPTGAMRPICVATKYERTLLPWMLPAHNDPLWPAVGAGLLYALKGAVHVRSSSLGRHQSQLNVLLLVAHDVQEEVQWRLLAISHGFHGLIARAPVASAPWSPSAGTDAAMSSILIHFDI